MLWNNLFVGFRFIKCFFKKSSLLNYNWNVYETVKKHSMIWGSNQTRLWKNLYAEGCRNAQCFIMSFINNLFSVTACLLNLFCDFDEKLNTFEGFKPLTKLIKLTSKSIVH